MEVTRPEAERLLEQSVGRGNLLLRPGGHGQGVSVTTRQELDGCVPGDTGGHGRGHRGHGEGRRGRGCPQRGGALCKGWLRVRVPTGWEGPRVRGDPLRGVPVQWVTP